MQNLIKRNSGPNRRAGMEGKTLAEKLAQNERAQEAVLAAAAEAGEAETAGQTARTAPVPAARPVQPAPAPAPSPASAAGSDDTAAIVAAAKAMRDRYPGREAPAAPQRTCLIVDDSRVIRKVSSKIALSLGYVPIEAENGEEALARCKKSMPDLVLTDWNMPEMDGIEFVRRLRAIPTPKEPTVVFCTSNGEAKDIHDGIAAGADDYIVKPFDEAALKAKLEKLGRG
ncbi:response regulator [Porphyrobacter sp. HT-58-2]|uniref:response regulator n=1 Tax=Porphyrobacter sp. HT-58-2 TaxID=2023229 RepID=UPI0026966C3C